MSHDYYYFTKFLQTTLFRRSYSVFRFSINMCILNVSIFSRGG